MKGKKSLYQKYKVTRTDGKVEPEAEYFVLKTNSKNEVENRCVKSALLTYAMAIQDTKPELAAELKSFCLKG